MPALATASMLTPAGLAEDVCNMDLDLDLAVVACCSGQDYRDGV